MRSERRAHRDRLKKKRRSYYAGLKPDKTSFYVDTPTPCSCYMCGNPRRFEKKKAALTVQERRFECVGFEET